MRCYNAAMFPDVILICLVLLWAALRIYKFLRTSLRQPPLLAKADSAATDADLLKAELPNPPRRRFQFSLWMLMVVVTAICVVAGILRWLMPVLPVVAVIVSMWVAEAAVVICQFDFRGRRLGRPPAPPPLP
jgi:hypothetical protein